MFLFLSCISAQTPSVSTNPPPTTQQSVSVVEQEKERQQIEVFFWDTENQKLIPSSRSVLKRNIEQNAIDALYEGPNATESSLTLLTCASSGARIVSIEKGLAIVQLQGNCSGCGSMSIYDNIVATLNNLPSVQVVHVLDPQGNTQSDGDHINARPACLNP